MAIKSVNIIFQGEWRRPESINLDGVSRGALIVPLRVGFCHPYFLVLFSSNLHSEIYAQNSEKR